MKNKLIFSLAFISIMLCASKCKDDDVVLPVNQSEPNIVGLWQNQSGRIIDKKNGVVVFDSSFTSPFSDTLDAIDYIRLNDSLVFFKYVNDLKETQGEPYRQENNYVLSAGSGAVDTIFYIDSIAGLNMNYTIDAYYAPKTVNRTESYKSRKVK